MTDDEASSQQRLQNEPIVWLATVRPDGRPHLTPIWFCWVRDHFWICTNASAVKTRNISANHRVSVSLQSGTAPIVAEGHATIHQRPYPADVSAAFLTKFEWDITSADNDGPYDAVIEIVPERWIMGSPR